ncbi:AAA family ATPase [Vibrio cyclitrophicus]|uniref:AAA family ATPase n=1 Tax=Vibrio cyclitrophicus TaxID=47951 RepID=UPI000C831B44|nr:ATP-binding protein [Vibrio cyclitrophicus]PMH73181.1 hypothetical protein BCU59_07200 [Vibrio cyclitrophicus]
MTRLILVCGPTGAGKTTYSMALSKEIGAVKFSIDPWMQTLFAEDIDTLDFSWVMSRVERCCKQIWVVCEQILSLGGSAVLDLGFTTKAQRNLFVSKAFALGIEAEVHYLDFPSRARRERIAQRNVEKDPDVFAFEVTETMFDFMEPKFEQPDQEELKNGCWVRI